MENCSNYDGDAMDANKFWASQSKKNRDGKPKHTVSTDSGTPGQEVMSAWIDKWQNHFSYFDNDGCGCCVNIYRFDAPPEAVAELPAELVEPYEEINQSPHTGSSSNFGEFFRSIK